MKLSLLARFPPAVYRHTVLILSLIHILLRRSHVLVVCGHTVTEAMKNDIAVAQRLGITATTLDGILTVKGQGRR